MTGVLSRYKNQKVLITGHTGFKGGWLSFWLSLLGAEVIGYSLKPPSIPNLFNALKLDKHLTHVLGDINDFKKLSSVFKKYKPSFVFHLAAQPFVRYSYEAPLETYRTNIMGTAAVLEAVRLCKSVRGCIIVTSDKCYENKEWLYGYREIDPMGGYDPYSSSKGGAELIVAAYRQSFFNPDDYGKKHHAALSSVRAGNIIGGGDWGQDRLVPDCIRALSKNKIIIIRNPQATRPWQYVLDSIFGYLILGVRMLENAREFSGPWNFGPNDNDVITVEELVKTVIACWGRGNYKMDTKEHPHEAHLLKLDAGKARVRLGWRPVYKARDAVAHSIRWYRSYYERTGREKLAELTVNEIKEYEEKLRNI